MDSVRCVLDIPIYNGNGRVPHATLRALRLYVERFAELAGLDGFIEESVIFYACWDAPILVIWGELENKTKIVGLSIPPEDLRPESAIRQLWENHRTSDMTSQDVHNLILETIGQLPN